MEAEIERARSELWILKASFERSRALWERRNIAKQTFDEARAAYSQARHRVESLEEQKARIRTRLRYTVLKAPFDGVITVRYQEPGDMAAPGRPVLGLENPDAGYKVLVRVPTRILYRIGPGTGAVLDHDDDRLAAAVSRILPAVEAGTGLAVLEIAVESPPFGLPSGSVVGVDLIAARTDGLIVPARALLRQQDSSHVYVLGAGDRVRPVPVEILGRSNDRAAVSGDLEAGDRVVTADESLLLGLAAGQEVRPVGKAAP
jgi:RND family efflux transporter MFP subunit